ncbi:uncharacterized protein [Coffea arabica]|uniref:BZIP domain-containing protein n=1 Tax=Coffea arabica TaxID=13443 RepID=A0ABM4U4P2_COFAR|nr:uncharacterized protein LOC113740427 [Coffea arabica]
MGRNRVYGSLEEARAEKNRRKRERRATAQRATKNDAPLGVCTLAVTAFNIREPNTMKQPNMAIAQSLLSSGSSLPSTENNAEQFPAENEQNVSASIANGANEVSTTNVSIGQSSLRRKRRSTTNQILQNHTGNTWLTPMQTTAKASPLSTSFS